MRKFVVYILIVIFAVSSYSCMQSTEPLVRVNLIGTWNIVEQDGKMMSFERADTLRSDKYGVRIEYNGVIVDQDAGFCGTPPLYYTSQYGYYSLDGDILTVEVDYWGGKKNFQWQILTFGSDKFSVSVIKTEYHPD